MKTIDILQETYSALTSNKVRTGLTMLGIVIGISSVMAMVSVGQGAQSSIESSIQSIGSNLIIVSPGVQRGPGVQISGGQGSAKSLKQSDADAIASEISSITAVSPELSGRYQVLSKGKNTNTTVLGSTPKYPIVRSLEIDEGTFINEQNVKSISKVAVLGPTARDDLFGVGSDVIGQNIRIKNIEFKIIGVTKAKGGTGFSNQDDMIFIPLSTAQRYLAGDEYVTSISVEAQDANSMRDVQQQITDLLLQRHGIKDSSLADFSTLNQADIIAAASSVTGIFTILLGSIAGISLLVGGIGIMNMMLTTVTERTREIGLRKAIGAKRKDVNTQFIVEAIMLTFVGGIIGVMVGWLISYLISYFTGIQTSISIGSIILAFGVSALIGIVFGYYPARRASRLNPIEALRYE